jgi:tetratricopeptide (TPR) repeat protein/tRNA A-37 threonylcarbamoyl transferase component Bud32
MNGHGGSAHDAASSSWLDRLRRATAPPPPGTLGPYVDLVEIGRGGEGVVWRGRHRDSGAIVALKRLRDGALATREALERFVRSCEIAARLDHPAIVAPRDVVHEGGIPVLVMDWIDGLPLDRWFDEHMGSRDARVAARLIAKTAEAVGHAHHSGVVHRDLKPGNVLVDRAGEVHVLDFGLATARDALSVDAHPGSSRFLGTVGYAAPEVVVGGGLAADARSDVYALGAMLADLAFAGRIDRVSSERTPRVLRAVLPNADKDLLRIVERAMARDPARRPPDGETLAAELAGWLRGERVATRRAVRPQRATRSRANSRSSRMLVGVLLITGCVALIAANIFSRGTPREARASARASLLLDVLRESAGERGIDPQRQLAIIVERLVSSDLAAVEERALLGDLLLAAGDYAGACRLLRSALENGGREMLDTATALTLRRTLAAAERARGEPRIAEQELRRAIDETSATNESVRFALFTDLALVLADLDRFDESSAALEVAERLATTPRSRLRGALAAAEIEILRHRPELALAELDRASGLLENEPIAPMTSPTSPTPPTRDAASSASALFLRGQAEAQLGRLELALTLHREALRAFTALHGIDHPATARAHAAVGTALLGLERPDDAERHYAASAAILERRLDDYAATSVDVELALAALAGRRGDSDGAMQRLERAEALLIERLGPRHPSLVTLRVNRAEILLKSGRLEECESLVRNALELALATCGEDHHDVAFARNGLGVALRRRGDLAGAREQLESAITILERAFADGHPHLVITRNNYCTLLAAQRDPGLETALRAAHRVAEAVLPEAHPDRIEAALELGRHLLRTGDGAEEAIPLLAAAIDGAETLGSRRELHGLGLSRLAAGLEQVGRFDESRQRHLDALDSLRKRHGEQSEILALASVAYGQFEERRGRLDVAREAIASGVAILERCPASASEMRATMLMTLAQVETAIGGFDAALEAARRARGAFEAEFGALDARVAATRVWEGKALLGLGRHAEAEESLSRAIDDLEHHGARYATGIAEARAQLEVARRGISASR